MGGAISLSAARVAYSYAVGAESSGQGAAAQGFRFVAVRAWRALQRMGQVQVGRA